MIIGLTQGDIKYVLRYLHDHCDHRDNCEGCPYGIEPRGAMVFMTCALAASPCNWEIDKFGGESNEQ